MRRSAKLPHDYTIAVGFPDTSGFEIIEMLMVRSKIARHEPRLTSEQRQQLEIADRKLMRDARRFYQSAQEIASLPEFRAESGVLPSHWWWYLDALVEEPATAA